MPTKVAEAYVSIRANTATLMADMQTAKGLTMQGAMGMGQSFPAGMAPGINAARAQIMTIPATTAKAATAVKAQAAGMSASFGAMAKSMAAAMGVLAGGAALVIGAKKAIDFDRAMIQATSAMEGGDEAAASLAIKARDVGVAWGVGATKAAEAMGFLALAGYNVEESMAGMEEVIKFGIAGNFDAATAADILTDAVSALGFSALTGAAKIEKMKEVADALAKASVTANTSVQQMGEAILQKAGVAAANAKMPMNDLNTMLLIFADKGRKGAEAGTLAATAIEGLSTAAAKDPGGRLATAMFDAQGALRPMPEMIQKLTDTYGDMSVEARYAAFAQDGISRQSKGAINMLMGTADAARKYGDALNNAGGFSDELANKKMKGLGNQLKRLKAMFEDFSIAVIGPLVGAFIDLLKPIMYIVMAIGRWSEAHNNIIPKVLKITAAVLGLKLLLPFLAAGIKLVAKSLMTAMMSNPFTMVIMGLALVIQYMVDAAKAGAEWMKPITAGVQTVMGWLSIFWEKVKAVGQAVIEFVTPAFIWMRDVVVGIVSFFVGLWTDFTDMMDSNISGTRTGWQTAWEVMRNVFEGVVAVMTGIWNALSSAFMAVIGAIGDAWQYMMGTTVGEALSGAWAKVMEWLAQMLDMMSLLSTNWSLTWELIKTVFYLRWLQVLDFFKTVVDYIIVGAATLLGVFVGTFKAIWEYIRYTFQMIWATIKATFSGLVAMAKEAWMKMTFRGSGKSLGAHYSEAFAQSMRDSDVKEVKGFKQQITEQVERFAGPAAKGAKSRQARRDREIQDEKNKAAGLLGQMSDERDAKRKLEDEAQERKMENVEEVKEAEKDAGEEVAEENADAMVEAVSSKKIQPEIGFKGIAEFGRSIQEAMLKGDDEKDKARDDKQAKDTGGILDVGERQLAVQERQLTATEELNTGLIAPG